MNDIREVIAEALRHTDDEPDGDWDYVPQADAFISTITTAGYRIIGPDELDDVTVTRCAAVATEWDNHEGYTHIGNEGIADAIRSLKGGRS